ncbi:MAG: rhodanese-related sulfurtransferase [Cyclobacteriaceae bacterium]|jgi:rhodanese-related sulfurtransferase
MFNLFKKSPTKYNNIDATAFAELIKKKNHVVLDVRSPGELPEGAVPGHIMINFFDSQFKTLVAKRDKSKTYLVYCRSGNRSAKACALMSDLGFTEIYNLKGGIGAWNKMPSAS